VRLMERLVRGHRSCAFRLTVNVVVGQGTAVATAAVESTDEGGVRRGLQQAAGTTLDLDQDMVAMVAGSSHRGTHSCLNTASREAGMAFAGRA
jgi:NADPH-dependent glutamate synthase beta subunit-like oxidoreductase